jgi:hypothetical protein
MDERAYAKGWIDLALSLARDNMRAPIGSNAADWGPDAVESLASDLQRCLGADRPDRLAALGALIQLGFEDNDEFNRLVARILPGRRVNPACAAGLGDIAHLYRNGIMDDWEIFLAWTDEGYVLVNETERRPQDARFDFDVAPGFADRMCRGMRSAPGEADLDSAVVALYTEAPSPHS